MSNICFPTTLVVFWRNKPQDLKIKIETHFNLLLLFFSSACLEVKAG